MSLKKWVYQSSLANRRLAPRRIVSGLTACFRTESGLRPCAIRDVSATGLFLLAPEVGQPGSAVALTLQRAGASFADLDQCVPMEARVVRCEDDGVALAFDLPCCAPPALWMHLLETAASHVPGDDLIRCFQMSRAFAFLAQICPSHASQIRRHIRTHLTGQRLWNAVRIALKAERLVALHVDAEIVSCDAGLVMPVIEEGSWTEEKMMSDCWASLLATACLPESADTSPRELIALFAQLTPAHYRILSTACAGANKYLTRKREVIVRQYTADASEVMRISDTRDLLRMGRALEHLSELGLLQERFKTSMFAPIQAIDMTPTQLGLLLYARCVGHTGPLDTLFDLRPTLEIVAAG